MGENQAQALRLNTSSEREQLLNGHCSARHSAGIYRSVSDESDQDNNGDEPRVYRTMSENLAQTRQVNILIEREQLLNGYGRSPRHSTGLNRNVSDASGQDNKGDVTYWGLLSTNREYRFLLSSYLITHCGEWLTYIASIDFIESQMQKSNTSSRTAISILVATRLLPNVFLSLFGGTLADSCDRRKSMIFLDVCGAICALSFVVAYQLESINLIYLTTFLQESIAGLYQPCSGSIIPLMVTNDSALQKATTLSGVAWSAMAAFGSAAGGFLVAAFGSRNCFLIDSATYMASACLLCMMRGDYNVADTEKEYTSPWHQFKSMTVDGVQYLRSCFFGSLIFLKFTGGLVFGASDVLNVALSEQALPGDFMSEPSQRLGILFGVVGAGCLVGPLIAEPFVDLERPMSLQLSCVVSFGIMAVGLYGWGFFASFWSLCVFAFIRAAGSSMNWINSSLLLQKFSEPQMLGRVIAVDFALALLTESASAYVCGILVDQFGFTASQVSFSFGNFGVVCMLLWGWYHYSGHGAAGYHKEEAISKSEKNGNNYASIVPQIP